MSFFNIEIVCKLESGVEIQSLTVEDSLSIRKLKTNLISKLTLIEKDFINKPNKEKICPFLNYGFVFHTSKEICSSFIPEYAKIYSFPKNLISSNKSGLMFMYKSSFRNGETWSKLHKNHNGVISNFRKRVTIPKIQKKLIHAIIKKDLIEMNRYLVKGIDPNFIFTSTLLPPIFHAADVDNSVIEPVLELLIKYGAHIDFRTYTGVTVMHYAVLSFDFFKIRCLLRFNASLNDIDQEGSPAWFNAIKVDTPMEFFDWLINLDGTDLLAQNDIFTTGLHICAEIKSPSHMEILLESSKKKYEPEQFIQWVNFKNQYGNTALHLALSNKSYQCIEILNENGASIYIENSFNQTPLSMAKNLCDLNILTLFNVVDIKKVVQAEHSIRIQTFRRSPSPKLITAADQNTAGINFGFQLENAQESSNKINTLSFKRRNSTFKGVVRVFDNQYPPLFQVTTSYFPKFHQQLQLYSGEVIQVFLSLVSGYSFGRKKDSEFIYGWFPSSCVGLDSKSSLEQFQETYNKVSYFKLSNLLCNIDYRGFIPIFEEIQLKSGKKNSLGIQLAYSDYSYSISFLDSRNPPLISPHYVRSINENSIVFNSNIRLGDRLIAIQGVDVTKLKHDNVIQMLKKHVDLNGKNSKSPFALQLLLLRYHGGNNKLLMNEKKQLETIQEEIRTIINSDSESKPAYLVVPSIGYDKSRKNKNSQFQNENSAISLSGTGSNYCSSVLSIISTTSSKNEVVYTELLSSNDD